MQIHKVISIATVIILTVLIAGGILWWANEDNNYNPTPKQSTVNSSPNNTTPSLNLNTPEPIIDWQTYTSDKLGFSVDLPATWRVEESDSWIPDTNDNKIPVKGVVIVDTVREAEEKKIIEDGGNVLPVFDAFVNRYSNLHEFMLTYGKKDPNIKSLEQFFETYRSGYGVNNIQPITVDGKIAFDMDVYGNLGHYAVVIENDGIYVLSMSGFGQKNWPAMQKHIVGSFKFIETESNKNSE